MEIKDRGKALFGKRLFMSFAGVFVCAFSVGLFRNANFGVDPFQSFSLGIAGLFPSMTFGNIYLIISLVLLLLCLVFSRHLLGLATLLNAFLSGYIIDFSTALFNRLFPEPGLAIRIALLLAGVVVMCFASAFYYTANMGVSVYDAIALTLAEKKVAPFRFCRIGTDLLCVIVGAVLGALPGVGTIVTAFFMGPLIDFFNRKIARPFLNGRAGGTELP